jgi:hypothetical protein
MLVLSPNTELASGYFQLLMYTLLEYKYGAQSEHLAERMIGISLDLPSLAPDGSSNLPWVEDNVSEPMILWQAPTSHAGLYFGDKWVELHDFLSNRLMVDPSFERKCRTTPTLPHEYPTWLQAVQEMMQAGDYYMLYPTFQSADGRRAVTVHRELLRLPEEHLQEEPERDREGSTFDLKSLAAQLSLTADNEIQRLLRAEQQLAIDSLVTTLLEAVSSKQQVKDPTQDLTVPSFSFNGARRSSSESLTEALTFAQDFARSVGGCSTFEPPRGKTADLNSLFCADAV